MNAQTTPNEHYNV